MSSKKRLVITEEMKPYIIEKYTEYYNGNPGNKTTKDVGEELNKLFSNMFKETYNFDESAYRKIYNNYKDGFDNGLLNNASQEEIERLAKVRSKTNIERKVLQTEKIEINKIVREFAREQVIIDKIINEVKNLEPLKTPQIIKTKKANKCGILCFGDEHYGVEFEIKGLFNEIINKYNTDIFEKRMNELLSKTIEIIKKENLKKIYVYSMGDFCDGILRTSQLMKLQYGVVESTVKYMNFICNWLNKLSEYVIVEFQMTNGNHSELRMLGEPKGTFTDDNMGKIVAEMIKARLEKNKNFIFIENPTGMIYSNILNYNILGVHGEYKDMEKAIKDLSKVYNIRIDILIGGHVHHTKIETVGINSEVINVPSIMGIDKFALSLNKIANPGATFLIMTENEGITCQHNIKLGTYK